jgi:hypothetical protein
LRPMKPELRLLQVSKVRLGRTLLSDNPCATQTVSRAAGM